MLNHPKGMLEISYSVKYIKQRGVLNFGKALQI
jgi:hypothetical protein